MAIPIGAAVAGAGLITDILSKWIGAHADADRVKVSENFRQSLQAIQFAALKASYGRKVWASLQSENINLGRQASSLSKNRIGVAGTTPTAFSYLFEKGDREREGYELELDERISKLAIERKSSELAKEKGVDYTSAIIGSVASVVKFGEQFADYSIKDSKKNSDGKTGGVNKIEYVTGKTGSGSGTIPNVPDLSSIINQGGN